jgi:hypothetical protein
MPIEVKMERELSFKISVSDRPESHDLYEKFRVLIETDPKCDEWVLSDWIVCRTVYPIYPAKGDIKYEDGGFDVENIKSADLPRFKEILGQACHELKLELVPEKDQ